VHAFVWQIFNIFIFSLSCDITKQMWPTCRALLLPRLGMWLACRAYYACVVRMFIKHTISLYISSFTPLYVYTSIRPIIFFHLPRFAILGTLKRPRPYSSSRSNRRRAHSDVVVEPRSMSLTLLIWTTLRNIYP